MQLITWAWKLPGYRILNAPGWMTKDRFEVQATTGREATVDEERLMVQQLLASRFGLKMRRESREIPRLPAGRRKQRLSKITPRANKTEPNRRGINIEKGSLYSREGSLDDFAEVLTTNLDRPVLNRTQLTGPYDFTLTWDDPPAGAPTQQGWSPIGPALFTAVKDLGLRLEAQKAPVEMLVIDAITRPSGN